MKRNENSIGNFFHFGEWRGDLEVQIKLVSTVLYVLFRYLFRFWDDKK